MLTRLSSTSARITEVGDAAERLAVLFKKHEKLQEDKFLVALINGKLLTYLDAMCVASPEQYKPFADDCSKIITNINAAVKNRSKKEAKPKEMKNEGIEGM